MSDNPENNNVICLEKIREERMSGEDDQYCVATVLCLECTKKWIATVAVTTSLFSLECPHCHGTDSFAALIPQEYLDAQNGRG